MEEGANAMGLTPALRLTFLLLNCILMALGSGGPLLLRIYFLHGGKRMWLSSLVQIAGWPLMLIPLSISYVLRCRLHGKQEAKLHHLSPILVAASAVIGVLVGLDGYLFAFSSAYLPVSTSSLLSSTQMAFVALFALLIVRQRFTPFSVNSVVLLTLAAVTLGVHTAGDRPAGVSKFQYGFGFIMTIAAAALYGFTLPLVEMMYMKAKQEITYSLVMEIQMVMSIFASGFCIVGMLVNKDFQAVTREARDYGLGEEKYYIVLIMGAIFWQMSNLGLMGIISFSSSLFAGIMGAVLLPASQIVAVIFFNERFDGGKGVSLALSLWGFASYWYGELQEREERENVSEVETPAI